ncbi:efflux RND transporter periplasmic adaptor subunit [Confluentibacter flavum]|uniref:Efflux transporter periplasmic adaptor subunit n=1 Tax=Confluentibacter flavum TaxID=1909700 RepID=A0A2N3HI91_9FLAO|nr:efflux RND transporter periplasmic adaptor subunit [Confluentibacter flavum]PKQ44689.1 efflux transporter periplasmic adaptor subunit [Confluentibacter flavum]
MKHIYILLFSLVFVACGNSEKQNETVPAESLKTDAIVISQSQFTSEQMQLGKLEEHAFNETIKTSGMIDVPPQNKASISTFMGGYITKTPLLIGDKVKKGQVLVTLENPDYVEVQQHYLELSEQLNYLKSEFDRQKTLYDEKITSQKNFLKAESSYKSSLAQYNGLRKKLSMIHINPSSVEQGQITSTINLYAPIDGYVTKVNVSNGVYVSPSDVIMEIVDTEHIHLELSVFEKDILNVKKDQKILFKIPEASQDTFEAKVYLVGTVIDEKNRIVNVHGHITDENQTNFIVGMFVEATITNNVTDYLALPNDAITEIDNQYFALALTNKTNDNFYFKKIKLDIGKQTETFTEITNQEDLLNKEILTKGIYMLLNEGGE